MSIDPVSYGGGGQHPTIEEAGDHSTEAQDRDVPEETGPEGVYEGILSPTRSPSSDGWLKSDIHDIVLRTHPRYTDDVHVDQYADVS